MGHKPYNFPDTKNYRPIQVGYEKETFTSIRDNIGESISEKNKNYCELTALYWAWKNDLLSDIIGICHYRRYFDLSGFNKLGEYTIKSKDKDYLNQIIRTDKVEEYLYSADIILPCPVFLGISGNLQTHYNKCHKSSDLDILKQVVLKLYPEYENALEKTFHRKWMYAFNMFVMKREYFEEYMQWLFSILFTVEKYITIDKDEYQARVFGFLSERLLNVYVDYHKFKIKEVPYLFIDDSVDNHYVSKSAMILSNFKQLLIGNN